MALSDAGYGAVIINTGCGSCPQRVTLADDDVQPGDILGYSSGWKRALATVGSVIQGRLVALDKGNTGDIIAVSTCPVIQSRYTTAVAGASVYVAEGSAYGHVTETKPTTGSDAETIIGISTATDTVQFFLNRRADDTV